MNLRVKSFFFKNHLGYSMKKIVFFILVAFISAFSFTQSSSADITTEVIDESGNQVQANVTITNTGTNLTRSEATDSEGFAQFSAVPAGNYLISIVSNGYNRYSSEVSISAGDNSVLARIISSDLEDVVVTAFIEKSLNFESNETGIKVDVDDLYFRTPQSRSLENIMLLAPQATFNQEFGIPSVSGSTSAENGFYINGFNVVNQVSLLGYESVPFDFIDTVDVKAGGFQAEFGKVTGGLTYVTTRSGTNEFEAKLRVRYAPDALLWDQPNTYSADNDADEFDSYAYSVMFSGPIVEDRLFYSVIANPSASDQFFAGETSGRGYKYDSRNATYAAKIDAYFDDNNILELTYFNNSTRRNERTYAWTSSTNTLGDQVGDTPTVQPFGGETYIASFTSVINDVFSLNYLYGETGTDTTAILGETGCNIVRDYSGIGGGELGVNFNMGCWTDTLQSVTVTENYVNKLTFDVDVENHFIRFGYEQEVVKVRDATETVGNTTKGIYYYDAPQINDNFPSYYFTDTCATWPVPAGASVECDADPTTPIVVAIGYQTGGNFKGENSAFFIQDSIQVSDNWLLNVGLRWDTFTNFTGTADASPFIDSENNLNIRLGATWDVKGDNSEKMGLFLGNYRNQLALNTAVRLAGGEYYFLNYYEWGGEYTNDRYQYPIFNEADELTAVDDTPYDDRKQNAYYQDYGDTNVDVAELTSTNVKPSSTTEFIWSYDWNDIDGWAFGVSYTYREMDTVMEDLLTDQAVYRDWCPANGISAADCYSVMDGAHHYVIANPGEDVTYSTPDLSAFTGNARDTISLTAEQLGYIKPERTFHAVDFTFEKTWDRYFISGSATVMSLKGTYEGGVDSRSGQNDYGITEAYDHPESDFYNYGLLPNHRDFKANVFGGYDITDNISFGYSFRYESARYYSCQGALPTYYRTDGPTGGLPSTFYGNGFSYNFCHGNIVPRGQAFKGDELYSLDTSFNFKIDDSSFIQINMFNPFNLKGVDQYQNTGEVSAGEVWERYQQPLSYVSPRQIVLEYVKTF